MRVIIPAAGKGSRLMPYTARIPKCMVPVGGTPIIERLLAQLHRVNVDDVICVTGYRASILEDYVQNLPNRPAVRFVHNPSYRHSDNIVSLLATTTFWNQEISVIDSDVVAATEVIERLVTGVGNVAVVDTDRSPDTIDMAIELRNGVVWHLDKLMSPERISGEFFGLSKWTATGAEMLSRTMASMVDSGVTDTWYPYAIREVAKVLPIRPLRVRSSQWIEIDNVEDLNTANARSWSVA